jgi:hypothetical protein
MSEQSSIPTLKGEQPTDEQKRLVTMFEDMKSKQPDFLDESGKSLVERAASFLAILFAITAFSSTFPPPYLKGNFPAKVLVTMTLISYLIAIAMGTVAIWPCRYRLYKSNLNGMEAELAKIIDHKVRWMRGAGIMLVIGSIALAALIISIIWTI